MPPRGALKKIGKSATVQFDAKTRVGLWVSQNIVDAIVVALGMPGNIVKYRCRARLVRRVNLAAIKETLPVLLVTVDAVARLGTKALGARRQ